MVENSNSAFAGLLDTLDHSETSPVVVSEWPAATIATIMASAGSHSEIDERLRAFAGARGALPLTIGLGVWLVLSKTQDDALLDALSIALGERAAVFDQSGAFGLLDLTGAEALRLLQKGFFVDLARSLSFDGASVSSVVSHINVTVWRVAPNQFGLAIPRSYIGSFWHWLTASAAAEGLSLSRHF